MLARPWGCDEGRRAVRLKLFKKVNFLFRILYHNKKKNLGFHFQPLESNKGLWVRRTRLRDPMP